VKERGSGWAKETGSEP